MRTPCSSLQRRLLRQQPRETTWRFHSSLFPLPQMASTLTRDISMEMGGRRAGSVPRTALLSLDVREMRAMSWSHSILWRNRKGRRRKYQLCQKTYQTQKGQVVGREQKRGKWKRNGRLVRRKEKHCQSHLMMSPSRSGLQEMLT